MNIPFTSILLLLSLCLWTACDALNAEEVARLPINAVSLDPENPVMKEASLELKQGEKLYFWSEMDFEYEGEVQLLFRVELLREGESMGVIEIDPTVKDITIGQIKTTIMDKTSWSFSGKNNHMTVEESGSYTFKGVLVASDNPTLVIDKAEIVLKK
ncbi:MAG: hypothetical protein AAFQ83_20445 [Bacteroidota bacterium]